MIAAALILGPLLTLTSPGLVASQSDVLVIPGNPALLAESTGWQLREMPHSRVIWQLLRFLHADLMGQQAPRGRLRESVGILWDITADIERLTSQQSQLLSIDPVDRPRRKLWERFLDDAGYQLSFPRGDRIQIKTRSGEKAAGRRRLIEKAGLNLSGIVAELAAGRPVAIRMPMFEVPLPLGMDYWVTFLPGKLRTPAGLLDELIVDRRLAFFYMGLPSVVPATLGFVSSNRSILEAGWCSCEAFAQFARSLRVVDGRIVIPLEAEGNALWKWLVGVEPGDAAKFIASLLTTEGGHAAWLFDTLLHLPPSGQRFVTGTWLPPADRLKEFRRLYDAFRTIGGQEIGYRPFDRRFDAAALLGQVLVQDDGRLAEPNSRRFLKAVFDSVDVTAALDLTMSSRAVDVKDLLTAGGLIALIFNSPVANAERRAQAYSYAQRLVSASPTTPSVDLAAAMRGRELFPTLITTLERLHVTNGGIIALAVRRAERFRQSEAVAASQVGLAQYQSCLALLLATTLSGAIAPARASALVSDLSEINVDSSDMYAGGIARWLSQEFIPKLRQRMDPGRLGPAEPPEVVLFLAASGQVVNAPPPVAVEYAGFEYIFDPVPPARDRIEGIRKRQERPSLSAVVRYVDLAALLPHASSVTQFRQWLGEFQQTAAALQVGVPPNPEWKAVSRKVIDDLNQLWQVENPKDIPLLVARFLPDFGHFLDWTTAYLTVSWVYAVCLGGNAGLLLGDGDVSQRHELGLFGRSRTEARQIPWNEPRALKGSRLAYQCPGGAWAVCYETTEPKPEEKWHVEGSILGLDLALGPQLLVETVPVSDIRPELLGDSDRAALLASTKLSADADAQRRTLAEVTAILTVGRRSFYEALATMQTQPERRFAGLSWVSSHRPEELGDIVLLLDVFRLGLATLSQRTGFDVWGANGGPYGGCACLMMPLSIDFDGRSRYYDRGYLAFVGAELHLRLAELMVAASLPVALESTLYSLAIQELLLSGPPMGNWGDWESFAAAARSLTPGRLQEYLALLTRNGYLKLRTSS